MDNNRKHSRTKLKSKCLLVVDDGSNYPALLDDLSFSGALIELESEGITLHIGDTCQLILSLKTAERPLKRMIKIVRRDAKKLGVRFIS